MRKTAVAALALVACAGAWVPARAQLRAKSFEVSPHLGVLNGSARLGSSTEPQSGLRFGYNLNRWWQVELSYSLTSDLNVERVVGRQLFGGQDEFGRGVWLQRGVGGAAESDGELIDFNIGLTSKRLKRRWLFYGTIGIGQATFDGAMTQQQVDSAFPQGPNAIPDAFDFDMDGSQVDLIDEFACFTCQIDMSDPNNPTFIATGQDAQEVDSSQWNIGGGMRVLLTDTMALRVDLRNVNGISDTYSAQVLTAGLSFRFGGEPPIDDDTDGVPSFRDRCDETPVGATVDAVGCPADSDGDEILDGLDACADTPGGWPVDDKGCPLDTDGDGVPDGRDTCGTTPAGAVVDFEGCSVDSDSDGIADGIDQCALTPAGAVVDEQGCPIDSDQDGVADGIDQCADTERGLPVDAQGCPIDSDGDGLKDDVDACREFAGPGGVDDEGCPRFRLDKLTRVVLPDVKFAPGSSTLTDAAREDLSALAAALQHFGDVTVDIEGHTDDIGAERDNYLVSLERARSVRRWLIDAGVDPLRLTARGFGEIRPIGDNATAEGRAKNRRVEVLVTGTVAPSSGE